VNKLVAALDELREAEEELADAYAKTGDRLAVEPDVWHACKRFAEQCHAHAEVVRAHAARLGEVLRPGGDSAPGETPAASLRQKVSELAGRRPESGLLLLGSLRQLYVQAQGVSFHWLVAGQIAQATRNPELLADVDTLHRETLTQIKWLKTMAKEASPQALVAGIPLGS
jgi:hypothetical protein